MLINEHHAEFVIGFDPVPVRDGDTALVFKGNEVLLRAQADEDRLPRWEEIAGAFPGIFSLHAFTQGGRRFFIASASADKDAPASFAFENVRVFRGLRPAEDGALLNTAYHLSAWYEAHRFCGACGGPMRQAPAERALECGNCGRLVFPTILPAVIVAITDGGRILLARNARGPFRQFSLVAGYVEAGETAEQTVRREVLEEVGLRVKNIRYLASQPWGVSQSLMLGFSAELDGDPTIRLQESELSEARWFGRDETPAFDSMASIASDLIDRFRRGLIGGQD